MPVEIEQARAICLDCQREDKTTEIVGDLLVKVYSIADFLPVGTAQGSVVNGCISHHRSELRPKSCPQHAQFNIFQGDSDTIIGKLLNASEVGENCFRIIDEHTAKVFKEEIRRLRLAQFDF